MFYPIRIKTFRHICCSYKKSIPGGVHPHSNRGGGHPAGPSGLPDPGAKRPRGHGEGAGAQRPDRHRPQHRRGRQGRQDCGRTTVPVYKL